jgi:ribonuclease HI
MKKVELYTDGACSGNPGPGGFGAILRYGDAEKEISGGEKETTNNRMELLAVISGLEALKEPCEVKVITDSKYFSDALEKGWLQNWKNNGWKKSNGKPVLNTDLWTRFLKLSETHKITTLWIKGHAGHPENERCDKMAVGESKKFQ